MKPPVSNKLHTIIIAIPCLWKGGTEFQTLHLANSLLRLKYKIKVVVYFEYDFDMVKTFETHGATVECLGWNRSIKAIQFVIQFRKFLIKQKASVLHVQYMAPGFLPIIAARLAGLKKVIATVHQPYTKNHGKMANLLLRFSALLCHRFIAVSKSAEQSWFDTSQLYDESIPLQEQAKHFTIYNAVDVNKIKAICSSTDKASFRNELGIPEDGLLIGAVSRLRHEKGIDVLLEAFYQVQKENKNTHLLVVGAGPDEKLLKAKATQFKINDKVIFFGEANWERAMQHMALMDVVVVPSRFEGFGLTAAEAMAMGKPVVASAVYGLKEVVVPGVTGLLFKTEVVKELVQQINVLLNDTSLRQRLGNNGQTRAYSTFDTSVYHNKVAVLYEAIINAL